MEVEDEKDAGPSDLGWVQRRELVVQQAIDNGDLRRLAELAALPGGFGSNEMRKRVWYDFGPPILLGTDRYFAAARSSGSDDKGPEDAPLSTRGEDSVERHGDEEQVGKDTNRSFVSYPKGKPPSGSLPGACGLPAESKEALQADLHDLIVGVLRRYPTLSYFQGYHDILSVLYLTYIPLPTRASRSGRSSRTASRAPSTNGFHVSDGRQKTDDLEAEPEKSERESKDWQTLRQCAEVVSLCRVRDAMGPGMEAMMGYLRILKRVLKAADPEISRFSAMISPVPTLPFFALSWILTLFSHDVDTLEPIQRMFDYLLSRNPISAIYLAVAILVAKKPQMLRLVKQMGQEAMDDPSILHPLFARLPPLLADDPESPHGYRKQSATELEGMGTSEDDPNPYDPIALSSIFGIADDLMARYPWDGPIIRGNEILGEASSVRTYARETDDPAWSLSLAETLVHGEVIKPGAGLPDGSDDEELPEHTKPPVRRRPRLRIRLPRNKVGTIVAVGVVLVGIGIAVYGTRSGGPRSNWFKWWSAVLGHARQRRSHLRGTMQSWVAAGSDALKRGLGRIL